MSTSLADLLDALDAESRKPGLTPADSAAALGHAGRAAQTLGARLIENSKDRYRPTVQSMGILAVEVAEAWPGEAGRNAQLAGAIEDVVALHVRELNQPDLKVASVTLTACINRFALCIQANSASFSPLLDELFDNTADLRHRQAAHPASAGACHALRRPLAFSSIPAGSTPDATVAEAVDGIADFLHQAGRSPLTVRQILAVSRVSEVISSRLEEAGGQPGSHQAGAWTELREQLALLSDARRDYGYGGNGRIMADAATADRAITSMTLVEIGNSAALRLAGETLPLIASALGTELREIQPSLFVPVGERPLSGQTAPFWLRRLTFQPQLRDLDGILDTIDRVATGQRTAHAGVVAITASLSLG